MWVGVDFPSGSEGNLPAMQEAQVQSLGWEDSLEKQMATYSVFLPREFHGQRSLVGYSPWDCKESDMTLCNPTTNIFQSYY